MSDETELHLIYAVFAVVGIANILMMTYNIAPKYRAANTPQGDRLAKLLVMASYASAASLALIAYLLTVL